MGVCIMPMVDEPLWSVHWAALSSTVMLAHEISVFGLIGFSAIDWLFGLVDPCPPWTWPLVSESELWLNLNHGPITWEWEVYQNIGDAISATRWVIFRTPVRSDILNNYATPQQFYSFIPKYHSSSRVILCDDHLDNALNSFTVRKFVAVTIAEHQIPIFPFIFTKPVKPVLFPSGEVTLFQNFTFLHSSVVRLNVHMANLCIFKLTNPPPPSHFSPNQYFGFIFRLTQSSQSFNFPN